MNSKVFQSFSRRTLLTSLGAGAALCPLLPLLNAHGQEPVFPKRLLLFFTPDGTSSASQGDWRPNGSETDFTFRYIHEPLQAFRSRIVVPWGMRMSAGGAGEQHAYGIAGLWTGSSLHGGDQFDGGNGNLTGWGSGPSIDQYLASQSGEGLPYAQPPDSAAQETPYRTLELGVQCLSAHSVHRMIYKGDNQPVHPEMNPTAAFDRLFGGEIEQPGDAEVQSAQKLAQLDLLMKQTARLRGKVGSADYQKVDAHLEGLRAISRRVSAGSGGGLACSDPAVPASGGNQGENSATFRDEARSMMEMAVHALACDLTRVASVQLSRGFSEIVHSWLGHTTPHHRMSHEGGRGQELADIDRFYAERFVELLTMMDAIPEGDGTLLDNTLVLWGRELGDTDHRMSPVPLFMAGGANLGLRGGRFLDVDGQPSARFLVSALNLMGIDTPSFGNVDPDSGPLPGLI